MRSVHILNGFLLTFSQTMSLNGDWRSRVSVPQLMSVKPIGENELENRCAVVVVRNATKNYGKGNVVEGLNMTVKQGTIYSFLGSSGCGKSTTLECIVGLRKFTSGKVLVFGKEPGSKFSDVPGKFVGYMPQDYSLYKELTIEETLNYFGTMNGMNWFEISKTLVFYNDLLHLPKCSSSVSSLSGGQKRRVSLVVALIHNPPLLILDEPTVGMDPLLCENVLGHLTQLALTRRTTVIITTHYIEGARRSDTIGVMRNGKLIAETSPQKLLKNFQETSLESVVLKLCKANDGRIESNANSNFEDTQIQDNFELQPLTSFNSSSKDFLNIKNVKASFARTRALVNKNFFTLRRNYFMLYIAIIFPATGLFPIHFGFQDPKLVHFGVVNMELNGTGKCDDLVNDWNRTCAVYLWSCKYLHQLVKDEFILHYYDSTGDAEIGVHRGVIWGFLFFSSNYSDELYERSEAGAAAVQDNDTPGSNIVVRLDKSSNIMASYTQFGLMTAFTNFLKEIFEDCGLDSKKVELPLDFKEPILGKGLNFSDFVFPSFFVIQMLFMPVISSGLQFVIDKRNKTMQRAVVAGTHIWEIFISYAISEMGVSILRLLAMYGIGKCVIGIQVQGSLALETGLMLLIATVGMSVGFLFGLFCTDEVQVALLAMGVYMPNFMLSGAVWPLEGLHDILRNIAYFLPPTLPNDAMRSMWTRGWGLENEDVRLGFIAAFAYILIIFLGVVLVSKRYKPW